jgi:hypothetical protein
MKKMVSARKSVRALTHCCLVLRQVLVLGVGIFVTEEYGKWRGEEGKHVLSCEFALKPAKSKRKVLLKRWARVGASIGRHGVLQVRRLSFAFAQRRTYKSYVSMHKLSTGRMSENTES